MHGKQDELKGISPRAQSKTRRAWRGPATWDGGPDMFLHVWQRLGKDRGQERIKGLAWKLRYLVMVLETWSFAPLGAAESKVDGGGRAWHQRDPKHRK